MRSCFAILALGLFVVLISGTSAQQHEVYDNCDDDEDGTCSAPLTPTNVINLAEQLKEDATYKAHAILKALNFDYPTKKVVDEGSRRDGKFIPGFVGNAMNKALAVLKIFDVNFNANAYLETVGVGAGANIEIGTTSRPATAPQPAGCNCTQSNYEPCRGGDGICSSASECQAMGGESIGKCANCLGCSVCCKYVEGCQGMTDKMITYFQSPAYPRTDRSNEVCSLTLNVREEVCQVRLDLIDFEMAAPVCGDCSVVDNLEIINTGQPGGVLGPGQSRLCGLNSGQHVYLPVKPNNIVILKATTSGVRNVPLAATGGRNRGLSGDTAFRWNVRVTQIPCKAVEGAPAKTKTVEVAVDGGAVAVNAVGLKGTCRCNIHKHYKQLAAPWGCTQYFDDNRGKLKSFNFDAQSEVSTGLDYAICVKRTNDACGMTLNALTFSLPASPQCLSGAQNIDNFGGLTTAAEFTAATTVNAANTMTVCCTETVLLDTAGNRISVNPRANGLPGVTVLPAVYTFNDTPVSVLHGANYLGFSGFTDGTARKTRRGTAYNPNQNRYYYCGSQLGSGSVVVGRTKGPLIMRVKTSEEYWGQCCLDGDCTPLGTPPNPILPSTIPLPPAPLPDLVNPFCPDEGCQGFLINYNVNTGSC